MSSNAARAASLPGDPITPPPKPTREDVINSEPWGVDSSLSSSQPLADIESRIIIIIDSHTNGTTKCYTEATTKCRDAWFSTACKELPAEAT